MEAFDGADASESCARRESNLSAAQALELFNSDFAHECSRVLAKRIRRSAGDDPASQAEEAFRRTLNRSPNKHEMATTLSFLKQTDEDRLPDLCLALFNSNEFLYID